MAAEKERSPSHVARFPGFRVDHRGDISACFLHMDVHPRVGPTEVGLVLKRFSFRKLKDDNPIAFHGEPVTRPIF